MNPDAFCSILCHKPEKLTAKLLGDLFAIHCVPGADKARSLDFWMGYLQETEGKKKWTHLSESELGIWNVLGALKKDFGFYLSNA